MKKNLLFTILCVLGLFGTLNAQVVTIDGTVGEYAKSTSKYVPIYSAFQFSVSQQYYTAEEINVSGGTIESIAFKTADVADDAGKSFTRNLEVYMVNTDDYAVVGRVMKQMSASNKVFSGEVAFTSNSWITIDITDFEYESGKNILICINDVTGKKESGGITFDCFESSYTINDNNAKRSFYLKPSSTATIAFDPTASALAASGDIKQVPFVQFTFKSGTTEEYQEPVTPTNFVATAVSESKVQLSWDGNANNTSYNIYQGTELIANVEGTSYAVKNLAPGEYYFSVKGANGPKESEAVGANVTLVEKAVKSITIGQTWNGDSFTAPMSLLNPVEPEKLDSWVEQIYTAEEIGQACTIERLSFPIKCTTTGATPITTKEIKIYLAETAKTDCSDLAWTAVSDLELVYSDTDIIIGDQEWETFEFTAPFNYSGEKNLAVVVAKSAEEATGMYLWHTNNVANSVLYTNETSAYTVTLQGALTNTRPVVKFSWVALTITKAEATSTSSIALEWSSVKDATSYDVYQGETLVKGGLATTECTVEGLDPYTEYCFTVVAKKDGDELEKSDVKCVKTLDITVSAPSNVKAEVESATSIVLTWDAAENALSYNVYNGETLIAENVEETTYTVEDLAPYTEYSFAVATVRNEQEVKSEAVSAKTLDITIAAVEEVNAIATSDTTIVLTWTAVENALSYNVYNKAEVLLANVTETTYAIDTLKAETEYCFAVTAVRNEQETEKVEACATTLAVGQDPDPVVPTNVVATAINDSTIVLTWDAAINALSYNVYSDTVLLANVTETTFTIDTLTAETEYCFAVSSVRNEKETEKVTACATTLEVEDNTIVGDYATTFFYDFENGTLEGWNVIDANNDGVKWQFKDGMYGGVNDGKGLYSGMEGGSAANDYIVTASKYSVTKTSELSFEFTAYDYFFYKEKIAAVISEDGENFETVWSYEYDEQVGGWQTTTISLKAYAGKDLYLGLHHYGSEDGIRVDNIRLSSQEPAVPTNVTATATTTTVTLTWNEASNSTSYNVYAVTTEVVEEVETVNYTLVKDGIKETTFVVEGLTIATEYSYAVTAVNEFKESKYSAVVTVTTLETDEPETPADTLVLATPVVKIDTVTSTTIVFSWTAVEGAKEYALYFGEEKLGTTEDTIAGVQFLEPNTEYCFTVTAVSDTVESERSEPACATTLSGEAIAENEAEFNIYPNPVNDVLFIETEVEVREVVIYDVYGRQQTTVNGQQSTIDVSNLNSGIYFVKVVTDNGEVVKRFVKK